MGCSIITGIQTILIIGGVIKMIPLTGVTLPLVSYGGTSMLSTFIIMGIVQELSLIHIYCMTEEVTEIPRCFSISIQSETACLAAALPFTAPAS